MFLHIVEPMLHDSTYQKQLFLIFLPHLVHILLRTHSNPTCKLNFGIKRDEHSIFIQLSMFCGPGKETWRSMTCHIFRFEFEFNKQISTMAIQSTSQSMEVIPNVRKVNKVPPLSNVLNHKALYDILEVTLHTLIRQIGRSYVAKEHCDMATTLAFF